MTTCVCAKRAFATTPAHTSILITRVLDYMASDIPRALLAYKVVAEKSKRSETVGVVALLTQMGFRCASSWSARGSAPLLPSATLPPVTNAKSSYAAVAARLEADAQISAENLANDLRFYARVRAVRLGGGGRIQGIDKHDPVRPH